MRSCSAHELGRGQIGSAADAASPVLCAQTRTGMLVAFVCTGFLGTSVLRTAGALSTQPPRRRHFIVRRARTADARCARAGPSRAAVLPPDTAERRARQVLTTRAHPHRGGGGRSSSAGCCGRRSGSTPSASSSSQTSWSTSARRARRRRPALWDRRRPPRDSLRGRRRAIGMWAEPRNANGSKRLDRQKGT